MTSSYTSSTRVDGDAGLCLLDSSV